MAGASSSGGHDVREQKPEGCPLAFLLSYRQEDTLHRDIRPCVPHRGSGGDRCALHGLNGAETFSRPFAGTGEAYRYWEGVCCV